MLASYDNSDRTDFIFSLLEATGRCEFTNDPGLPTFVIERMNQS